MMPADFVKGASGPADVYDTSPAGLGLSPAYLAGGASVSGAGSSAAVSVTIPASPTDAQQWVYQDATNLVRWQFVYYLADGYWYFIGGGGLKAEVLTSQTLGSTGAYIDLATAGPSVTVPFTGDYEITFSALSAVTTNPNKVAPKLGAAATSDNDRAENNVDAAGEGGTIGRTITRTLAASDVVKLQYSGGSTSNSFALRNLRVTPVRVH